MDARLQRRVQQYGWDRAASDYEMLWRAQLADPQVALLNCAALAPGERVLDVACGTGLVSLGAARAVGSQGYVHGVDLSAQMVTTAAARAAEEGLENCSFARMDGEALSLHSGSFDAALCSLGLMYMPNPEQALREMRRTLRPGGRVALAVWGARKRCGWSDIFPIVDAEVRSEVCPLFFRLGEADELRHRCIEAGFESVTSRRLVGTLSYANANEACDAMFIGGPVALAWSRFDSTARSRVRARFVESIASWREGVSYHIPGEFVVVAGNAPDSRP